MPRTKLARAPLKDLQREIERRREQLPKLIAQRDELDRRIAELEGLAAPKRRAKQTAKRKRRVSRKPAKGTLTLNDALAQVLQGKEAVSITDALKGVLALGYETRAKDFRFVVNRTLARSDRFKRVAKGVYALKA